MPYDEAMGGQAATGCLSLFFFCGRNCYGDVG